MRSPGCRFVGVGRVLCGQPFLVAVLATLAHAQPTQALRNVKVGDKVPSFSVQAPGGKTLHRADYKGKILLLVFARPQHGASLEALKAVQRILRQNTGSRLAVLAVSTKSGVAEHFKGLAAEHGLTFPIALDPGRKMYGDYGLIVAPTTVLIDESGVLRFELPHMPPNFERKLTLHTDLLLGKLTKEEYEALLAGPSKSKSKEQKAFNRQLALAQALIDQGSFDSAVPVLTKLRSKDKTSILVAVRLGTCYLRLGKVQEATECLDPLAGRQPCPPEARLALGRLELRRGNDGPAEKHLLAALEDAPDRGVVLYELGRLYQRQGKLEKAVDCYRRALDLVFAAAP